MARSLSRPELRQLVDSLVLDCGNMASHSKAMLYCTALHYLDGKIPLDMTFEVDRWPDYTAVLWTQKDDEVSVLSFEKDCVNVSLYWTNEDGLRQLLTLTSVDWTRPLLFMAIPLSGLSVLKEHLELQGVPCPPEEDIYLSDTVYYLHETCPSMDKVNGTDDKMTIAPLKPEHSQLVSRTWLHGNTPEAERHIHYQISTFPSACVYDQEGNPVSWILFNYYGSQGVGYTIPDHRGKGYFQLASKYMINTCLQKGFVPFLFIEDYNEQSRAVHKKLGYSWVEAGRCAYIFLNRNKSS
ncbi:glycine N-acyltransferase-like protein 3 [Branchiostoma floridae]|uniref:Glycine N-acyltransferase-like protein n=1 Tax=Branchiostoma floridae TaxID=7739 RepID=A0A9J7LXH4_BRAFL|nr:glycine N-acyltransferase-like protein 3 [Branchiostoma floridae]